MAVFAFGVGVPTHNSQGDIIDCFFPAPVLRPEGGMADAIEAHSVPGTHVASFDLLSELARRAPELGIDALGSSSAPLVVVRLDADEEVQSTAEAFLKLHLLSHRLTLPNTLNLDNIFAHLKTIAWTTRGAVDPADLAQLQLEARLNGEYFEVLSVDKFPKMTNYVVPSGVRLADSSRIRLGAYLGEGTTVMPYGALNFNSGTIGPNMVEGRVSQGVILHENTDLGGGASTMGTLSGGGEIKVSLGKNCLIGANGGTGIPLGDRCTIEAGLYITAGTLVTIIDEDGDRVGSVKAGTLAGGDDMLFIRHSHTGEVQCRTNRKAIELNEALHANN